MRLIRRVWIALAFPLSACLMTAPSGSPETGYTVQGFVGQNSVTPAPMIQVALLEAGTARPVATTQTNYFGGYSFAGLPPGNYVLQVEQVQRQVMITTQGVRLDIDLSARGGTMDYATGAVAPPTGSGSGKAVAAAGPNDPQLQQQIAGVWWGYAGSTERQIGLCPDGTYREYRESSYSGRSSDSLGNETMAWGSASRGRGAGRWTITGDTRAGTVHVTYDNGKTAAIPYRQIGDPGCLDFSGSTLCRKSATCQ